MNITSTIIQYTIQNKTIIFNSEYNELFDTSILEILSNSNTIIFDNFKNGCYSGSKFDKPVDNLPNSIVSLTFGTYFDKQVDNLPNSIQNLTFGWKFNQQVDNLPNSIQNLTFGIYFNKPIDNLPNSIQNLTFCGWFNQLIKKLPIELKIVNIKNPNLNMKTISNSILQINPNIKIIEILL